MSEKVDYKAYKAEYRRYKIYFVVKPRHLGPVYPAAPDMRRSKPIDFLYLLKIKPRARFTI